MLGSKGIVVKCTAAINSQPNWHSIGSNSSPDFKGKKVLHVISFHGVSFILGWLYFCAFCRFVLICVKNSSMELKQAWPLNIILAVQDKFLVCNIFCKYSSTWNTFEPPISKLPTQSTQNLLLVAHKRWSLESNRTRGFPSRAEVPTDLLFVRDFIVFNYDLCSSVSAVNKSSWHTLL